RCALCRPLPLVRRERRAAGGAHLTDSGGPAPSGVITITTDFGHQGPFVGVMKGRILARFPAARIVDLTHEILVHWPAEAGFWLARAYRFFPPGTVHVAGGDPRVGTSRGILAAGAGGALFMGPPHAL